MPGIVKSYYAGGVRVLIDGIPTRVNRKPLPWRKYPSEKSYDTAAERAAQRVKEAERAIEIYADMLGISVKVAKAKIEVQRLHNLANPMRDDSAEYDL